MSSSDGGSDSPYVLSLSESGEASCDEAFVRPAPDFVCYEMTQLARKQTELMRVVNEVLNVPIDNVRALLIAFKWNTERLIGAYLENPNGLLQEHGIVRDDGDGDANAAPPADWTGDCPSCFVPYELDETAALESCGHRFCKFCWEQYLGIKIRDGEVRSIACPAFGCNHAVDESIVERFVDAETYTRYIRFLTESFVTDNPYVKWCPAAGCDKAIWCRTRTASTGVLCDCGAFFCFDCHEESHGPATCDMIEKWKEDRTAKGKGPSEDDVWIAQHTKPCPWCKVRIEKNAGCHHMTCATPGCGCHFCWHCGLADPSANPIYNHTCGRYNNPETAGAGDIEGVAAEAAEAKRFKHFFERFESHDTSTKFELDFQAGVAEKMVALHATARPTVDENGEEVDADAAWKEVLFMAEASDQLVMCRQTLKFSYVFGYYLPAQMERGLFDFAQEELERETEQLAYLLERPPIELDRAAIVLQTRLARNKLGSMLDTIDEGLDVENAAVVVRTTTALMKKFATAAQVVPVEEPVVEVVETPPEPVAIAKETYECSICADSGYTVKGIIAHYFLNHKDQPDGVCPVCEGVVTDIVAHLKDVHK